MSAKRKPACRHRCGGLHPNKPPCRHTNGSFTCTLPKGHSGPHIACGITRCNLAHWPNTPS